MSETQNIHDSETESDAPAYFSELFTEEHLQYGFIRFLMIANSINPYDQQALSALLQWSKGNFDKDIIRQAIKDAQVQAIEDTLRLQLTMPKSKISQAYEQIAELISEGWTKENEAIQNLVINKTGEAEQDIYQVKTYKTNLLWLLMNEFYPQS